MTIYLNGTNYGIKHQSHDLKWFNMGICCRCPSDQSREVQDGHWLINGDHQKHPSGNPLFGCTYWKLLDTIKSLLVDTGSSATDRTSIHNRLHYIPHITWHSTKFRSCDDTWYSFIHWPRPKCLFLIEPYTVEVRDTATSDLLSLMHHHFLCP